MNVGKTTFIDILTSTAYFTFDNIIVIKEPLNRAITSNIVEDIGYDNLLKFIISRKDNMIADAIVEANGNRDLYRMSTLIIVERSFMGDLMVRGCHTDENYSALLKTLRCYNYTSAVDFVHLLIHDNSHAEDTDDCYSEHASLYILYDTESVKFSKIYRPVGDNFELDLMTESINFCKHLLWLKRDNKA